MAAEQRPGNPPQKDLSIFKAPGGLTRAIIPSTDASMPIGLEDFTEEPVGRARPSSFVPVKFRDVRGAEWGIDYSPYMQMEDIGYTTFKTAEARRTKALAGKNYLVVGMSEGGIGQGIFDEIAAQGGNVIGSSSSKTAENKSVIKMLDRAKELGAEKTGWKQMDVTKDEDQERVIKELLEEYGTIDGVIIASGFTNDKPFGQYSPEELDYLYQVNGTGPMKLVLRFTKVFEKQKYGRFLLAGSVTAPGGPGTGGYGDSKAMWESRTRSLGVEFRGAMAVPEDKADHMDDLSIVTLALGLTNTGLVKDLTPSQKNRGRRASVAQRDLMPQEVGALGAYFFLPEVTKANGNVFSITGKSKEPPQLDDRNLLRVA